MTSPRSRSVGCLLFKNELKRDTVKYATISSGVPPRLPVSARGSREVA
jgi:hypothetical protein